MSIESVEETEAEKFISTLGTEPRNTASTLAYATITATC